MNDIDKFKEYYELMMTSGDCDPSYPALNYICDRFELNTEQRYWIAFLYGVTYCVPTTFYIYNEFPDYENVDVDRLSQWWKNNKQRLLFQTDRLRVKSLNLFIDIFISYKKLVGDNQQETFSQYKTYDELYIFSSKIYYFGRFSLFNYIESLNELTDINVEPTILNLRDAESSRNGLCYVFNKRHYITTNDKSEKKIDYDELQSDLLSLKHEVELSFPHLPVNLWNIETCLCAFKKLFLGTRYLGYYIDRQQQEILTMQQNTINGGVDWSVLFDFRREYFNNNVLGELHGYDGVRKEFLVEMKPYSEFSRRYKGIAYKKKVLFEFRNETIYGSSNLRAGALNFDTLLLK